MKHLVKNTKKLIYFLFASIFLIACGKVPIPDKNQTVLHFADNFESGNLGNFELLVKDTNSNTLFVNNPVKEGNYSLKTVLQANDFVAHGYRTELCVYECAKYKTEVFYGFSFMIDTAYKEDSYNVICQWQDLPDYQMGESWNPMPRLHGSSPPLHIVYLDNHIQVKMNTNPRSNHFNFGVGDIQEIQKGVWNDVVMHVYWSDKDDGFVECWLNGNLITPYNGTDYKFYKRNLFNRAGNYFKFGQYRGAVKPLYTNAVYFDAVKIGTSYAEVAP